MDWTDIPFPSEQRGDILCLRKRRIKALPNVLELPVPARFRRKACMSNKTGKKSAKETLKQTDSAFKEKRC